MKCMMSSDGTNIVRVSDEEASELYHNENFKYVAKSVWKEKVRDIEQPQEPLPLWSCLRLRPQLNLPLIRLLGPQ